MATDPDLPQDASGEAGGKKGKRKEPYWLLYTSILVSGLVLLMDAFSYAPMQKITARLGVGLLLSAFSLIVGNGRKLGYFSAGLIWVAVILTFVI